MSKHPSSSVYLASQSPRRHALLAQWGVAPVALLADANEDAEALEAVLPGEAPLRYVKRVTALKLAAAADRCTRRSLPPLPVVCADTTVALGREILGKPNSMAHARRMLSLLSGQKHVVYTAVSVGYWDARGTWQTQQMVSRSQVRFSSLSATQIASYVKTGEPMGKAGAYAIQGLASLFITDISGSYSGIMGLPAFETAQLLRWSGVKLMVNV